MDKVLVCLLLVNIDLCIIDAYEEKALSMNGRHREGKFFFNSKYRKFPKT